MWALPGVRVIVPHQQKYEWDYTYGAVEVSRAGSVFCFQSTVHQEASGKFLDQIVAHDPAAIHVVSMVTVSATIWSTRWRKVVRL